MRLGSSARRSGAIFFCPSAQRVDRFWRPGVRRLRRHCGSLRQGPSGMSTRGPHRPQMVHGIERWRSCRRRTTPLPDHDARDDDRFACRAFGVAGPAVRPSTMLRHASRGLRSAAPRRSRAGTCESGPVGTKGPGAPQQGRDAHGKLRDAERRQTTVPSRKRCDEIVLFDEALADDEGARSVVAIPRAVPAVAGLRQEEPTGAPAGRRRLAATICVPRMRTKVPRRGAPRFWGHAEQCGYPRPPRGRSQRGRFGKGRFGGRGGGSGSGGSGSGGGGSSGNGGGSGNGGIGESGES